MADISKIKVGQQVVLTIGANDSIEGDYFGRVCVINQEKTRVQVGKTSDSNNSMSNSGQPLIYPFQLKDVVFGSTKRAFTGAKLFYLPEILAVKIISDVPDDNERAPETTLQDSIKFELNANERETMKSRIRNYCVIETVGEAFDKALQDISHYYFVALTVASGFVVCSTPHKIFVFNVETIGGIKGQFKEWFESDTHTKVVHGAKILEQNLFDGYGVRVKGVFDTKAVHKMFLSHIELPSQLVEESDCRKARQIGKLIDRTAILLKFHDFLTEHLLRNAYQSFQLNMDYCRNKTSLEVQAIYRNGTSIVTEMQPFQCRFQRKTT